MKIFVTGAHGFIGRHLVKALKAAGHQTWTYDRPREIADTKLLRQHMKGADVVIHLAALADVRNALKQPVRQVHDNLLLTQYVLETMRSLEVPRIVFMSSAVVYGDTRLAVGVGGVDERCRSDLADGGEFPQQTSIYGAMKLASESLIAAYCHGYGMVGDVLRTVSVVGPGYRHGNLMDFYRKLLADPTRLEIFGTGQQQKYYIAVQDLCEAVLKVMHREHLGCELWNVSHDCPNTIQDSADMVCDVLNLKPEIVRVGDPWAGDLPALVLDCQKLKGIGWVPNTPILEAMLATVRDFIEKGL